MSPWTRSAGLKKRCLRPRRHCDGSPVRRCLCLGGDAQHTRGMAPSQRDDQLTRAPTRQVVPPAESSMTTPRSVSSALISSARAKFRADLAAFRSAIKASTRASKPASDVAFPRSTSSGSRCRMPKMAPIPLSSRASSEALPLLSGCAWNCKSSLESSVMADMAFTVSKSFDMAAWNRRPCSDFHVSTGAEFSTDSASTPRSAL
mmetsp:Transcript_31478/g.86596  ORF Transcript_31478/g.86596 Transcript_31478/m.86596 type:complete len:204 (+) Transcript_31478:44-655(+)